MLLKSSMVDRAAMIPITQAGNVAGVIGMFDADGGSCQIWWPNSTQLTSSASAQKKSVLLDIE
jgi:hypothetical protein